MTESYTTPSRGGEPLTDEQRKKLVTQIREVCVEIGCSGVAPSCITEPHKCQIIHKLLMPTAPRVINNLDKQALKKLDNSI